MKYSRFFLQTQKERSKGAESTAHDLSLRSGMIYQVSAGIYDFLPLGQRVINRIERIIRDEMNGSGAMEITMPVIHPSELWIESGRWDVYGGEMLKLENRDGRMFCLGPTHEETVCQLVRSYLNSYKQLPFTLYQVGRKFRDEKRPRYGLLRTKEFLMKDAYSFDQDADGLDESYKKMRAAYVKVFKRMGIEAISIGADPGEIGGQGSDEFIAPAEFGEDRYVFDGEGKPIKLEGENVPKDTDVHTGIEVGHVFKLGDRYSKSMDVTFTDAHGTKRYAMMGCYGIGISRLVNAIIEQSHDDKGIIWPDNVSPFDLSLLSLSIKGRVFEEAERIYRSLIDKGMDVLFDDRDVSPGTKFKDSDLIGIRFKVIVGPRSLKSGKVEIESRRDGRKVKIDVKDIYDYLSKVRGEQ